MCDDLPMWNICEEEHNKGLTTTEEMDNNIESNMSGTICISSCFMASFNSDSSRGHKVVILDFKHIPESEVHWIEIE